MKNDYTDIDISIVYDILANKTYEDALAEVEDRFFMLDMQDHWAKRDFKYFDLLCKMKQKLEEDIEKKCKGKTN